ncbi:MAG: hypothetical protein K2R98_17765 [Gemmataceae bacterium]|nr:hypothetical protein [Gemmataceae bacterium]
MTAQQHRRAGLATFELVMTMPLILLLFAVIFAIAQGGLARSRAVIQSRADAWKGRDKPAPTLPEYPPSWSASVATRYGHIDGSKTVPIRYRSVKNILTSGHPLQNRTTAHHFVLGGTWDHRQVTDYGPPPSNQSQLKPSDLLAKAGTGLPDPSNLASLSKLPISPDQLAQLASLLSSIFDTLKPMKKVVDAIAKLLKGKDGGILDTITDNIPGLKDIVDGIGEIPNNPVGGLTKAGGGILGAGSALGTGGLAGGGGGLGGLGGLNLTGGGGGSPLEALMSQLKGAPQGIDKQMKDTTGSSEGNAKDPETSSKMFGSSGSMSPTDLVKAALGMGGNDKKKFLQSVDKLDNVWTEFAQLLLDLAMLANNDF